MARARNIKPSIFKNELLGEADPLLTIVFIGLWCLADREGRLEDRPKRIKAEILPYRECPDFNGYLTVLSRLGFIRRYEVDGAAYIQVVNFKKHQAPHKTERASEIPEVPTESDSCPLTVKAPLFNGTDHVKESLIPDSLIPDSLSKKGRAKRTPFVKPTVEQVAAYCQKRGNRVDPQAFVDHYTANGWKRGKTPIVDWEACVRTWENGRDVQATNGSSGKPVRVEATLANLRRIAGEETGGTGLDTPHGDVRGQVLDGVWERTQ
jgi:hypothetical protein